MEHYSELYSRQNVVTTSALDNIKCLPVIGERDNEPIIDELSKAINNLASRKAPGSDGIPPDLIKHCKTTLLQPLHEVLCECWNEGAVPQDMRDAKIITLQILCRVFSGRHLLSYTLSSFGRPFMHRVYSTTGLNQYEFETSQPTVPFNWNFHSLEKRRIFSFSKHDCNPFFPFQFPTLCLYHS